MRKEHVKNFVNHGNVNLATGPLGLRLSLCVLLFTVIVSVTCNLLPEVRWVLLLVIYGFALIYLILVVWIYRKEKKTLNPKYILLQNAVLTIYLSVDILTASLIFQYYIIQSLLAVIAEIMLYVGIGIIANILRVIKINKGKYDSQESPKRANKVLLAGIAVVIGIPLTRVLRKLGVMGYTEMLGLMIGFVGAVFFSLYYIRSCQILFCAEV